MGSKAMVIGALALLASSTGCHALRHENIDQDFLRTGKLPAQRQADSVQPDSNNGATKSGTYLMPQNEHTAKYAVDGSAIPDVDFDIGESYAGLMNIGDDTERQLYFWLFPTENEQGKDTITIWLNGGPYCSSLLGMLQENGPFLWQAGMKKPKKNHLSWHTITNMIYVENPVGTGFTQGNVSSVQNEADLARDFLAFWSNLVITFGLENKKIYITGESFAGYYIPTIADAMFEKNDTECFDIRGTLMYDAIIADDYMSTDMVTVPYMDKWPEIFTLNDTYLASLHERHESCGWKAFIDRNLQYPPAGPFNAPPDEDPDLPESCFLWYEVIVQMFNFVNPCLNVYHMLDTCPFVIDPISPNPQSGDTDPAWFARPDVQKAINAPAVDWQWCAPRGPVGGDNDTSEPTSWHILPRVIERSERTILVNGAFDFRVIDLGQLLAVQNMTWGGLQGFQEKPGRHKFYVPFPDGYPIFPYWDQADFSQNLTFPLTGHGEMGIVHTERGFTWIQNEQAGHMVPGYAPAAALRHLEYLLGRIDSLTQ